MGKYFGTDGFRGKAGVDLTAEHAFQVGRFLGWYYSQKHTEDSARIVIGKDTRRSSYMFENALAAGITSSGADAYLLHVTTTPCVSYITRTENFDCGVMISASHNPFYDNGIKLMNGVGEKMDDALQAELEAFIDGDPAYLPWATEGKVGKTIDFYSGRNRYIGYLTSLPSRSFEKHKVGLDCANGSSWMIGRAVFDALGAKTYVINDTVSVKVADSAIVTGAAATYSSANNAMIVQLTVDSVYKNVTSGKITATVNAVDNLHVTIPTTVTNGKIQISVPCDKGDKVVVNVADGAFTK